MSMTDQRLQLVLQTVRLPSGTDQFVVPVGSNITRVELQQSLDLTVVEAAQSVVQPETGRLGTERLIALSVDDLSEPDKATLGETLRQWLPNVPSVIAEASQDLSRSTGKLPTSEILGDWQKELRIRFTSAKTQRPSSRTVARSKYPRGLFAMLAIGLLLAASFALMQPFFQNTRTRDASAKNDDASGGFVEIDKKWNLTKSEDFDGESDLLELLRPLVTSFPEPPDDNPARSDTEALAQLLDRINHYRLGTTYDEPKRDATASVTKLNTLLDDSQLLSDIRKLVHTDGTLNHFALIDDHSQRDALSVLIPRKLDDRTAVEFRQLALQLIGEVPVGDSGIRLTEHEKPFFNLADQDLHIRSYEALKSEVPKSFKKSENLATFFTDNDVIAAKHIVLYLNDIGYLIDGKLGFTDDELAETIQVNADSSKSSSHQFAKLLIRWKAFAERSQPAQKQDPANNDNPPVTNTP